MLCRFMWTKRHFIRGQGTPLDLYAPLFLWLECLTVAMQKASYLIAYSTRICYKNMKLCKNNAWGNRNTELGLEL